MRENGIEIKISRGDLATRTKEVALSGGELFFQLKNDENQYPNLPYSEGELYIGLASLDKSNKAYEKIADRRTLSALVCKGFLNSSHLDSSDPIFTHISAGDFFLWTENASTEGTFGSVDKFKSGDLLVVLEAVKDNLNTTKSFSYRRLTTGAFRASVIDYTTSLNSPSLSKQTNIRDAIDTVNRNSLHYKGVISTTHSSLITSEKEIGSLYSIEADKVEFPLPDGSKFSTVQGDLVVYTENGWLKIPTGVKASNISIDLSEQKFSNTFETKHVSDLKQVSNIQDLLYLLAKTKAQIGSDGKVPLSQLPDTVLGSLRYQGVWNPVKTNSKYDKLEGQNYWPGFIFDEDGTLLSLPTVGYFWIVQCDSAIVNIPYIDQDSKDIDGVYTRTVELNKGDWVIYTSDSEDLDYKTVYGSHFEIIDNSDRVKLVRFLTNTYISSNELVLTEELRKDEVGEVVIGTSHKIGLYDDNGALRIGGIRLIDQSKFVDSKPLRIPRYIEAMEGTDTIEPGTILDTDTLVTIFNNLNIGTQQDSKLMTLWGDLHLKPNSNGLYEDGRTSDIVVFREEDKQLYGQTLRFKKFTSGSVLTFPDATSEITAFLSSETYKPNYLLKRKIVDGKLVEYFTDSNIEEHLDSSTIELHLDNLTVPKNVNTLSVTFGDIYNPKDINDQGVSEDLRKTEVFMDDEQTGNTKVTLPVESGRLLTIERFNELLTNGTPDYIPIYGLKEEHGDTTLEISTLSMRKDYLYSFFQLVSEYTPIEDSAAERAISNVIFTEQDIKDLLIESDVIIGTDLDPKSLAVTEAFLLGNSKNRVTTFLPGRSMFKLEAQYYDPRTKEELKHLNTVQEVPAESGILLNNRSIITGGEYW